MLNKFREHAKTCRFCKALILFIIGGLAYIIVELLFRGHSHWTMFILGGLCFLIIGVLNEDNNQTLTLPEQGAIGAICITVLELITGCICNIIFHMDIWDYSNLKFNFLGQISLEFTMAWFFLTIFGVFLDDALRKLLFDENFPKYKW